MNDILEEVEEGSSSQKTTLSVPSKEFYRAIRSLKRILPSRKSDMPVSAEDCVQITLKEGKAVIWGQKDEKQLKFQFNLEKDWSNEGTFSIPVRSIVKPIRKLKKKTDVFLLEAENSVLKVDAGIAQFEEDLKYHGESPPKNLDNFDDPEGEELELSGEKFQSIIEASQIAVDSEADRRDFLRNILFRPKEDSVIVLASNGHIVSKSEISDWDCEETTIRGENFDPLMKTLDKENLVLKESENCLHIYQGNKIFSVKKEVDTKEYPSIEKKLPKWKEEMEEEILCKKKELKEGVGFLDSLNHEDEKIRLFASKTPLQLISGRSSDKDSSYQVLSKNKDPSEIEITFPSSQIRREYLKDVLKTSDANKLLLKTSSNEDVPLLLKEKEGNSSWYIMKVASKSP